MFKGISNFINSVKEGTGFTDDYEEDYEDEYEEEVEQPKAKQNKRNNYVEEEEDYEEEFSSFDDRRKKASKSNSKVVSISRNNKPAAKVYIVAPKSYKDDVEDISDRLIAGYVIVLNIEGLEEEVARRFVDFLTGTMHAIDGNIRKASKYFYIISPNNVELSTESENKLVNDTSSNDMNEK